MARISMRQLVGAPVWLRNWSEQFSKLETATIDSGVLTVTGDSFMVNPLPENSTADQIDSIACTKQLKFGDLLMLFVPATNTITVDDANINLGDSTRAIGPGGNLVLMWNGTKWNEISFLAGADNS